VINIYHLRVLRNNFLSRPYYNFPATMMLLRASFTCAHRCTIRGVDVIHFLYMHKFRVIKSRVNIYNIILYILPHISNYLPPIVAFLLYDL